MKHADVITSIYQGTDNLAVAAVRLALLIFDTDDSCSCKEWPFDHYSRYSSAGRHAV
jgi:hypothetical protein